MQTRPASENTSIKKKLIPPRPQSYTKTNIRSAQNQIFSTDKSK